MIDYFLYATAGKLFIYILQNFASHNLKEKSKFLDKLLSCDLCLGVWVYTFLAIFFDINIFNVLIGLSWILDGITTSFLVHLVSIGWKEKFSTYVIE